MNSSVPKGCCIRTFGRPFMRTYCRTLPWRSVSSTRYCRRSFTMARSQHDFRVRRIIVPAGHLWKFAKALLHLEAIPDTAAVDLFRSGHPAVVDHGVKLGGAHASEGC